MKFRDTATTFIKRNAERLWEEMILPALREQIWDERLMGGPWSKRFFESSKNFFKLGNIQFFREKLPEFDPGKTNVSWIPINQDIEGSHGITLPEEVLDRFIEKAKHRVIVNFCGCRKAMGCKHYPIEMGCLMMGDSALEIPRKVSREVDVEEAKAHVRNAIGVGLIPVTGKARIDNDIFMIPDKGKLLTVCLCCECCCIARFTRYAPLEIMESMFHPVEGLTVQVTEDCIGCGLCTSKCYIHAIEVNGGRASIGKMCRVCGRCALHCPQSAIKLKLDNLHAVEDVIHRIESSVDF